MKLNNFRYYLSQSIRSFIRNGLMSATSVFTVFCCMIIIGLVMIMTLNINYIVEQVKEQCTIQAYIDETYDDAQVNAVCEQIKKIPEVKEATVFTREQTYDYMYETLGDQASVLDGYEDDNPFRDSVKITLNDLETLDSAIAQVEKIEGVSDIANNETVMTNVVRYTSGIKKICLWIMIILAIVSIFIIANTIKLAVYARRREINVMKFVGATNWFIRWPFIFEGIIIGIVGALLSFMAISFGYEMLMSKLTANFVTFKLLGFGDIWGVTLLVFIGVGAVIGSTGSTFAVRKHLDV